MIKNTIFVYIKMYKENVFFFFFIRKIQNYMFTTIID